MVAIAEEFAAIAETIVERERVVQVLNHIALQSLVEAHRLVIDGGAVVGSDRFGIGSNFGF